MVLLPLVCLSAGLWINCWPKCNESWWKVGRRNPLHLGVDRNHRRIYHLFLTFANTAWWVHGLAGGLLFLVCSIKSFPMTASSISDCPLLSLWFPLPGMVFPSWPADLVCSDSAGSCRYREALCLDEKSHLLPSCQSCQQTLKLPVALSGPTAGRNEDVKPWLWFQTGERGRLRLQLLSC